RRQHPVARLYPCLAATEQVLVEERLEHVRLCRANLLARAVRAPAGERRDAAEELLLVLVEQVVRPRDGRAQGQVARLGVGGASEQVQSLAEAVDKLGGRKERRSRGGQLERQGELIEPVAKLFDLRRSGERRVERPCPLGEQGDSVAFRQRWHRPDTLALQLEPFPARHQDR